MSKGKQAEETLRCAEEKEDDILHFVQSDRHKNDGNARVDKNSGFPYSYHLSLSRKD